MLYAGKGNEVNVKDGNFYGCFCSAIDDLWGGILHRLLTENPDFLISSSFGANTSKWGREIFVISPNLEETANSQNITCVITSLDSFDKVRGYDNGNSSVAIPLCIYLLLAPEEIFVSNVDAFNHSHCGIVQFPCLALKHALTWLIGIKKVVVNGMISMSNELSFDEQKHEIRGNDDQSGWTVSDSTPSHIQPTVSKPQFRIHSSTLTTTKSSTNPLLLFADTSSPETQAALLSPHPATYSSSLPPLSSSTSSSLSSLTSPTSLASSSFSALLSFSQPIQQMSASTSPGPVLTRQPQPSSQSRSRSQSQSLSSSLNTNSLHTRISSATSQQSLTQASSPSHPSHLAHPGSLQQSAAVAAPTTSSNLPAAVTSSVIISTTSSSSLSSALIASLYSSATDAPPLLLGTYSPSSHTSPQKRFFHSPPRQFKSATFLEDAHPPMPSSHSSHSSHQEMRRSMELRKYRKANETSTSTGNSSEYTHLTYCSKQVLPEMHALRLMKREKTRNVTDEIFERKRRMRRRNRHSKK
ncbi:uncharacterized protein MONOS_2979 [Monocercomonoides exilis]|uniref:uncharacterized protein n=1 Tax=Monocercomonoides exilis TaxID=2049356 RepID=UPI00355AA884|nr:hypothetical protein MONOS_2979 [Monocercomonoides exilis]|eukprot:MONOS_2979.1-p1 / transcript=MONOS_2979.1 / gene=MONOS_2979 / organism=Monocercomonoides_exilis_PA203 / gene_product=unspecified product / transcript_product=unspecified product / location=Mono_scaffold00066:7764-9971(+) / protein_length=526 / sequence_SO=supercontig / SO=protein_coding / is_pseudo=false